jgi:hypothetical protein
MNILRKMAQTDEGQAVLAVGAHGLLNAVAAMVGAAKLLGRDDLPPDIRREMVTMITERGELVTEVIRYVLDCLPAEARHTLDLMDVIDLRES